MPILTDEEIFRLSREAFGDLGSDSVVIFGAICLAESGGNTEAVLDNVAAGYQPPGSPYQYDRGLPQINSIHGFDADRLLSDPHYAVACGRAVFNRQGFRAWSTFTGGQFQAYLGRMATAKVSVEAAEAAAVPDDFQRGRREMFDAWVREDERRHNEVVAASLAHLEWVKARESEWGIPK